MEPLAAILQAPLPTRWGPGGGGVGVERGRGSPARPQRRGACGGEGSAAARLSLRGERAGALPRERRGRGGAPPSQGRHRRRAGRPLREAAPPRPARPGHRPRRDVPWAAAGARPGRLTPAAHAPAEGQRRPPRAAGLSGSRRPRAGSDPPRTVTNSPAARCGPARRPA